MRVLVHARSLAPEGRLVMAAQGMALRGHAMRWFGSDPPIDPSRPSIGRRERHPDERAEVVLGGPPVPSTAWSGWLSGARAMVLSLDRAAVGRWGLIDRWCWESLRSWALVEPDGGEGLGTGPSLTRISTWSQGPPPSEADPGHPDTEILERTCERMLAQSRGAGPRPAAFLDRDGTLVVEMGYLASPRDLELLPGVPQALRLLREAGYALIVISNQSGVGRGFFPLANVHAAMARLRWELRANGVELDAIYFCPHRPDDGCSCRKPGTGLLEQAAADLGLLLGRSVMIGDKLLDVATGQRAGARAVLVRTGYGAGEASRLPSPDLDRPPDQVCADLMEAATWLLARELSGDP